MKNAIITVLLILVIALCGYIVYDKFVNNNKSKNIVENNNEDSTDILDNSDIYGYAAIYNDNTSKILILNKKTSNKEIENYDGRVYALYIKHNYLYYYVQSNTNIETAYYVDLNNSTLKPIELISGEDVVDYSFDTNNKYLFVALQNKGIKRVDLDTKEEKIIESDNGAYDLFIVNSNIYVSTYKTSSTPSYYKIDFEGENIDWISEEQYNQASNSIGYKRELDSEKYFIYNDSKVFLSNDATQLIYADKTLYNAKEGNIIKLMYSLNNEEIGFVEYRMENLSIVEQIYYTYNLKTNDLNEVSKDSLYDLSILIK